MKNKRILRFYFGAEGLNGAFDRLLVAVACGSAGRPCHSLNDAQRLCGLWEAKAELSSFWQYLDGVMGGLTAGERQTLAEYAAMRCGLSRIDGEKRKRIRAAEMKFSRRALRVERFGKALRLVEQYDALTGRTRNLS